MFWSPWPHHPLAPQIPNNLHKKIPQNMLKIVKNVFFKRRAEGFFWPWAPQNDFVYDYFLFWGVGQQKMSFKKLTSEKWEFLDFEGP